MIQLAQKLVTSATGVQVSKGGVKIITGPTGSGTASIPAGTNGDILFKAAWNYNLVINDRSYGLHNTGYTVGLLQSSIIEVRKALGLGDPPFVTNGHLFKP
jgi:hypothetical protein